MCFVRMFIDFSFLFFLALSRELTFSARVCVTVLLSGVFSRAFVVF